MNSSFNEKGNIDEPSKKVSKSVFEEVSQNIFH